MTDRTWLHGTRHEFAPGDLAGPPHTWHVWATLSESEAHDWAHDAKGEGRPRVYEVEPTGPSLYDDDDDQYKSKSPMRIVGERPYSGGCSRCDREHQASKARVAVRGHQEIYGGDEGLRHHLCVSHNEHLDEGASREHMEDLHEDEHDDGWAGHWGEYYCPDGEHDPSEEPTEFHDMHSSGGIGEIHRGIGVSLPDRVHRVVHDEARPVRERAQALLDHVSGHRDHLGMHWTTESRVAEDFAERNAQHEADEDARGRHALNDFSWGRETRYKDTPLGKPGTAVVLHSHEPSLDAIEHDGHQKSNGGVYGWSEHGEREVPVRDTHSLDLKGISWAPMHSDDEVPGHGEYTHHDFGPGREHTAAVQDGDPLPERPGIWYRAHLKDRPLDEAHARSRPLRNQWKYEDHVHRPLEYEDHRGDRVNANVGQSGYSAYASPWHLASYMHRFGWPRQPEQTGFGNRHVIAFHGTQVGTGMDREPLVMPRADHSCCGRVIHSSMPWEEFSGRMQERSGLPEHEYDSMLTNDKTPAGQSSWNSWKDSPEKKSIRRNREKQERRQAAAELVAHFEAEAAVHPMQNEDGSWLYGHQPAHASELPPEMHRGVGFRLDPDVHAVVHDESRPLHERAHALLRHLDEHSAQGARYGDGGLGIHWSVNERSARGFAVRRGQQADPYDFGSRDPHSTQVVFHAQTPAPNQMLRSKRKLDEHEIFGFNHGEGEIPLRQRTRVKLNGISWAPNGDKDAPLTRFDFPQPVVRGAKVHVAPGAHEEEMFRRHTASTLVGHFEAAADSHHGEGPWYHGTPESFSAGDVLSPGVTVGKQHMGRGSDSAHLWVSNDPWRASKYGVNIYEVDPHSRPHAPHAGSDEHTVTGATVVREVPYHEATATSRAYQEGAAAYAKANGLRSQAAGYQISHTAPSPDAGHLPLHHYTDGDPDEHVQIYRSAPAGTESINTGDWVSLSHQYAHRHGQGMGSGGKDWPVYTASVPQRHVYWDENDGNEHGYNGPALYHPDVHDEETGDHQDWDAYHEENPHGQEAWAGGSVHLSQQEHDLVHDDCEWEPDRADTVLNAARAQGSLRAARWHGDNFPARDDAEGHAARHHAEAPEGHRTTAFTVHRDDSGKIADLDVHHYEPSADPREHRRYRGIDDLREHDYEHAEADKVGTAREAASPEEYGMDHRPDPTGPPLHNLLEGDMMPRDVYDRMHEYNLYEHDEGHLRDAGYSAMSKARRFQGKPEKKVTIWRAAPAVNPESRNGKKGEINHGDWVGLSRSKAMAEAEGVNDPPTGSLPANHPQRYHIWSASVPAKHVRNPDGDLTEWGYWGPDVKDIPHIGEWCSHRARVKPREASVHQAELSDEEIHRGLDVVAHFATGAADPDTRQWGCYTMRHRTEDLGERRPRHFIDTTTPDGTLAGRMNWYGTTGLVHRIEVAGPEDDVSNGSSNMGDGREHGKQGMATAMWDWSQEMRPKAKHSKDQTEQGKNWARGLKNRERKAPPEDLPEITAGRKEASVSLAARYEQGLPNPHTGSDEWYHGTHSQPGDFATGFSHERYHSHEDEEYRGHLSHWNTHLGTHFAADHGVAEHFARIGSSSEDTGDDDWGDDDRASRYQTQSPQSVIHARLHLRNPKHYASEYDMDHEAYEHEYHERGNYIANHFRDGYEDEDSHDPHYDPGTVSGGEEWPLAARYRHDDEHPIPADQVQRPGLFEQGHAGMPERTRWLNSHPDKAGIARRFKERLQAQGHDGILYGNEFETEHATGNGDHPDLSAITFHPGQSEITQHHTTGRECLAPHEAEMQRRRMPQHGQDELPGVEEHADRFPNGFQQGRPLIAHFEGRAAAGPYAQQKLFHMQPDPTRHAPESGRHNPADPEAHATWREQSEEGYRRPLQDPERGTWDENLGAWHHPDKGYHCHVCDEFHSDSETVSNHETAHTNWDDVYPRLPDTMHRGLRLDDDGSHGRILHPYRTADPETTARGILHHLGDIGTHWTPDEGQARHYAGTGYGGRYPAENHTMHVVVHARKPAREDIETDPDELEIGNVLGFDHHDDAEIPLRQGAPVHATGVSWKFHDEPHTAWRKHMFGSPGQHQAALDVVAHFDEEDYDEEDYDEEDDGDRYVGCDQGHEHWGAHGAAGLLIRHRDPGDGQTRYLLQHRSPYVQHGDTWSTPGGALHPGESPEEGATREAEEEFGRLPRGLAHAHTHTDDHGGWAYHTVVMNSPHRFEPAGQGNWEHGGHGWFTHHEMSGLRLHPGFAASWGAVRKSGSVTAAAHFMDGEEHEIPPYAGQKLFHGTRSILHEGEMLTGGDAVRHPAHPLDGSEGYVHATPHGDEAQYWADHASTYTTHARMTELGRAREFSQARGENQGHAYPPRVYEVHPTGHVEPDPWGEGQSYRSASPMRVGREVRRLDCDYPEEHESGEREEHWPDHPHYEFLKQMQDEQDEDEDDGRGHGDEEDEDWHHEGALVLGAACDVMAPAGMFAGVTEAIDRLGAWEPADAAEACQGTRGLGLVLEALHRGTLRVAQLVEEMAVHPAVADAMYDLHNALGNALADHARVTRGLPPEAAWEEPPAGPN